jgi:hypothetical protein
MEERIGSAEPMGDESPADLRDALLIVKAWENGHINNLSPDGVAVALFLQRARVSRQIATTIGLAEV